MSFQIKAKIKVNMCFETQVRAKFIGNGDVGLWSRVPLVLGHPASASWVCVYERTSAMMLRLQGLKPSKCMTVRTTVNALAEHGDGYERSKSYMSTLCRVL
jgi:hypothetical protein